MPDPPSSASVMTPAVGAGCGRTPPPARSRTTPRGSRRTPTPFVARDWLRRSAPCAAGLRPCSLRMPPDIGGAAPGRDRRPIHQAGAPRPDRCGTTEACAAHVRSRPARPPAACPGARARRSRVRRRDCAQPEVPGHPRRTARREATDRRSARGSLVRRAPRGGGERPAPSAASRPRPSLHRSTR